MGYRIQYPPFRQKAVRKHSRSRLTVGSCCFFLLFMLSLPYWWPAGYAFLQQLMVPGDPAVTVSAMETFSREIQDGLPLSDSFARFCRSILEGSGFVSY